MSIGAGEAVVTWYQGWGPYVCSHRTIPQLRTPDHRRHHQPSPYPLPVLQKFPSRNMKKQKQLFGVLGLGVIFLFWEFFILIYLLFRLLLNICIEIT